MKNNKEYIKEIFTEFKLGNRTNFENFYNTYKNLVFGIAYSIIKNRDDSEDATQNVFLKIYNAKSEILPNCNELSWLYSVTKNESLQIYKKKNKADSIENVYEIQEKYDLLEESINKIEYNKLISKLPANQKEIISLKIISNFTFNEISKLLNVNESTVKWRYYKATHSLKLIISNLALFICTLGLGIHSISKEKNQLNSFGEKNENINKEVINGTNQQLEENDEIQSIIQDVQASSSNSKGEMNYLDNNTIEDVITEESNMQENSIAEVDNKIIENNFGTGWITVSAIFLAITISLLLFFNKYQLKIKVKKSK